MKRIILLTTAVLIGLSTLVGCPGKPSPSGPSQPTRTATPTTSATATATETFSTTPTPSPSPSSTQASTSTDTSSPTLTLTSSSTPTLTLTPTATPSPTRTVTPTPTCAGPFHFGYDVVGASHSVIPPGYLIAMAATLTAPATVTALNARLGSASGNVRLAIYDDLANWPNNLKVESASVPAAANQWNNLPLTSTYLPAGSYWLVLQVQSGPELYMESPGTGATRRAQAQAYGSFPPSFTNDGSGAFYQTLCLYADFCVGPGTPTPVNSPTFTFTPTSTGTPTVTPTYTLEPPACATPYHFGYDVAGSTSGLVPTGGIHCVAATLTAPATVTGLALRLGSVTGNVRLAIYDNLAGWPNSLKAQSGDSPVTANGWNKIDLPDTVLAPGAYWLGLQFQSGNSLYTEAAGSGAARRSMTQAYGPFPSTFTNDGSGAFSQTFSFYADFCVGPGTPTPAPTSVFTGTPTITATPTVTSTPTTEGPACPLPYHFGYDVVGSTSGLVPSGTMHCMAATLTSPATVTSLALRLGSVTGNVRLAVYDNLAGWPNSLKVQSGDSPVTANGWNTVNVPDTVLPAGPYWLGLQFQSGNTLYVESVGSAARRSMAQAYGPFPSTFPTDGSGPFSQTLSFYANFCVGSGTPTPIPTP